MELLEGGRSYALSYHRSRQHLSLTGKLYFFSPIPRYVNCAVSGPKKLIVHWGLTCGWREKL